MPEDKAALIIQSETTHSDLKPPPLHLPLDYGGHTDRRQPDSAVQPDAQGGKNGVALYYDPLYDLQSVSMGQPTNRGTPNNSCQSRPLVA